MSKRIKRYASKKSKTAREYVKAQRGQDRKHFFETDGDLRRWSPPTFKYVDRKKKANRLACRRSF